MKKIQKHFGKLPSTPCYVKANRSLGNGWTIETFDFSEMGYVGYFSLLNDQGSGVALLENGMTMMSITPLEQESHLLPFSFAHGKVVVAGLGLGFIALNLLKKPKVKELIILEKDDSIASNFESLLDGPSLELWKKNIASGRVKVLLADCKQPLEKSVLNQVRNCDYMWVDIWIELFSKEAKIDVDFMQSQIKAKTVDYWGLELDLFSHMIHASNEMVSTDVKKIERGILKAIEDYDLPISPKLFDKAKSSVFATIVIAALKNSAMSKQRATETSIFC